MGNRRPGFKYWLSAFGHVTYDELFSFRDSQCSHL